MAGRKRRKFNEWDRKKNVDEVDRLVSQEGRTVQSACDYLGIHPSIYYRWRLQLQRHRDGDRDALKTKSKRPHQSPRQLPGVVRGEIIALAQEGDYRSAKAIADFIRNKGRPISTRTVIKILREAGLYGVVEVKDDQGRVIKHKSGLIPRA